MNTYLAGNSHYNFSEKWLPADIVFVKGNHSTLTDIRGREYLDLYCNFGSNIIGHGNLAYVDFIYEAMRAQSSVSFSDLSIKAAEKVHEHYGSMELMRFSMTGTEVVQSAFRLSRAFTDRTTIVRFDNHYHGHSDNILGGTFGDGSYRPVSFAGDPRSSLGTNRREWQNDTLILPWNDIEAFEETMQTFGSEIACIILEPLNMNGGGIRISDEFLSALSRAREEYGTVIIFDEIITGNRTGLGGMQAGLAFSPDLTLLGKTLSGGILPVSAIGGRADIMSLLSSGSVVQAGTFNGYNAGMAAVLSCYRLLEQGGQSALKNMWSAGAYIRKELADCGRRHGIPITTQGHDGCFCIHVSANELTSHDEWTPQMRKEESVLQRMLFERAVCTAPKLRIYPNIDMTEQEICKFIEVFDQVLTDCGREKQSKNQR